MRRFGRRRVYRERKPRTPETGVHEPLNPGGDRHLACWQVSWLAAEFDVDSAQAFPSGESYADLEQ